MNEWASNGGHFNWSVCSEFFRGKMNSFWECIYGRMLESIEIPPWADMYRDIYAWVFFHDLPQPPPMYSFHSLIKRICFVPHSFFHPSFPISSPFLSPLLLWRRLFLLTVSNCEGELMLFWRSGLLLASSDFGVIENSKRIMKCFHIQVKRIFQHDFSSWVREALF